jgi:chitin synthase
VQNLDFDVPVAPKPQLPIVRAKADPQPVRSLSDGPSQSLLRQRSLVIESGFKNVVCMTLYNESFEHLRSSLSALVVSIGAQQSAATARATRSCIVIIADGRDRVDPEILLFFERAGLIDTGCSFPALGETVHFSRQHAAEIMADMGVESELTGEVHFAICVKKQNRGKLHSHALFFQSICPVLEPELCYQLDVGTVVAAGAISKLVAYMADEPDVAAAASRILTPTPNSGTASTLSVWQYMDFVLQKAVTWPTEVASGYLSVIPGQFCVFRWNAVSAPSRDAGGARPLDTYLRGLKAVAPLERVMFLAEDRVFGNEIVLARDKSWRIGYCPEAEATTDACDSFQELLRQRRRWQNSALAVRLWLWRRWPAYLARPDKSAFDKMRFTTAMLWQGLLTASDVISPAFLILLLFAAAGGLIHSKNVTASAAAGLMLAGSGVLAWLSFSNRTSRWQSRLCVARDAAATLSIALFLGFTLETVPFGEAVLLLAPGVLMAGVIAASMSGQRWAALRYFPLFLLTDRLISFVLYGYAFANMHNVSWGTKGLTGDLGDQDTEKRRMRRLRDITAGSIIAVNAGLIGVGLQHPGLLIKSESCVVEFFILLCLAVTATAAGVCLASTSRAFFLSRIAPLILFLRDGARRAPAAVPITYTGATRAA